jgi:GGDEF domain-containing protein
LSVVALKVDQAGIQLALPKIVQEVQQGLMNEFVMAGIARVLDRELHDFNLIALHDDCFVVVLPELTPEEVSPIAQRLGRAVQDEVGARLQFGVANFPGHAETFESLIEQAIENSTQFKAADKEPDPARLGGVSSTA